MAGVDKAAIAWTMAIVAIAAGIAVVGDNLSGTAPSAPPVVTQESVMEKTTEPTTAMVSKSKIPGHDRANSMQDPGIGHESHQIAIILPPSDNVYSGNLRYDTSEPIQLVSLVGPLGSGEDNGQPIWTPDGVTKFALTFVDPKNSNGEWDFVGNALAVHTMNTDPFIIDYRLDYQELSESDTVMTGTLESIIDPGAGHEFHSLIIVLPPSEDVYIGTLAYSASEIIQLVSLEGPLGPGETAPSMWSPDGTTNFALTYVKPNNSMGSWKFSGNALAVHTENTDGFTVSYAVSATKTSGTSMMEEVMEEEMLGPLTVNVSMPSGTSSPGCEETDSCFIPSMVSINSGDTVNWVNDDTAAHTVTSGSPSDGPDQIFDSSLVMAGASFEVTFDDSGSYDYFCMVHPWMVGNVQVS